MADIHSKILSKYGVDIEKVNLFKLYKLENAELSKEELEQKIAECRKKWTQSINGANERLAQRDRVHLEKADSYEAILKDSKLRKELYAYYNRSEASGGEAVEFARGYFSMLATTKKIRQADVAFFFEYFAEERKNKKAVREMLSKEFKVVLLEKGKDDTEEAEPEVEGKKKEDASPLIVNLFQKATILKLNKCEKFFQKAKESETLCQKYPALTESLYRLLELDKTESLAKMSEQVMKRRDEVFNQRQEKGQEYAPLVDLFNTLADIMDYRDVVDNFTEFKLLIQYPKLTPYMYGFDDMKQSTLNGIFEVAKGEYFFRDVNDFLLNYFIPVHDNFNVHDNAIRGIIKKAQKKANANKILNEIDKRLGWKKQRGIPIGVRIVHGLVYWPIYLFYLIFEIFKVVFTVLEHAAIPVFGVCLIGFNLLFPKLWDIDNLLVLGRIFSKEKWYFFLERFLGAEIINGFAAFMMSLFAILLLLMIYLIPSFFISMFLYETTDKMSEKMDWIGLERTFQNIFRILREKTEGQYRSQKKSFYKHKAPKIITNLICLAVLAGAVCLLPIGFHKLGEVTGYGQQAENEDLPEVSEDDAKKETEAPAVEEAAPEPIYYVVIESQINIRSGAGTEYNIVSAAYQGDVFAGTGNEEEASNGRIWYEIYLDGSMTETGWASSKVIEKQQ